MSFNGNVTDIMCTDKKEFLPPLWISAIKILIAVFIITENLIVFLAVIKNWKTLMMQHNLYRYVMSLVAADFMNGAILLFHGVFWIIVTKTSPDAIHNIELTHENPGEVIRNLITGVVHGLTFASLASAALLNLVLRVTSNRALARAAGIQSRSGSCMRGISWVRSPRITVGLIGIIWVVTLIFVVIPLRQHCDAGYQQCLDPTTQTCYVTRNGTDVDGDECDCSILRRPTKRTYLLTLNVFLSLAWVLLIICISYTTCIKSKVQRAKKIVDGKNNLKLVHSFGITLDSSSFFALIITINMTLSSLPFVVFTFVTEAGTDSSRVYYGMHIDYFTAEFVEMTTYISSIVNPFVYTAMLSRLRSEVSRLLKRRKVQKSSSKRIQV